MAAYGAVWVWALAVVIAVVLRVLQRLRRPRECRNARFFMALEVFPCLELLRRHESAIRSETSALLEQWVEWPENLSRHGRWSVVPFYGFGRWVPKNCRSCPTISGLLQHIPNLRTAILSRLAPRTTLAAHQGWGELANNVLRCHYVIKCTTGNSCFLQVEDERVYVQEARIYAFDDSKLHFAGNTGLDDRIVLLLDIDRPSYICKGVSTVPFTPELEEFTQSVGGGE